MLVVCQYCGEPAEFVSSKEVYGGRDFGMVYLCRRCNAYVGVHKGTDRPLGILANDELRMHRRFAHASFDRIWKQGKKTRLEAYEWLAMMLKLPLEKTHIGMFDVELCREVIKRSNEFMDSFL